ncbi:MAG: EthD family reductase [Gammaproteobacteria bacterium]|nr:EthD family reductase [Gammaproteobacteria bacterium]
MVRVSVMYPKQEGGRFDFDYYLKTHIPLAKKLVGSAMKRVEVYKGAGEPGGAPETYVAVASLYFDSVDAFGAAFGPVAEQIMADVPNYTNLQPVVQIEEQLL